jgi:hypothetical protein
LGRWERVGVGVRESMEGIYKTKVWNCGYVECGRVERDPWNKEQITTELEHESRNSGQYIGEQKTLSINNEDGMSLESLLAVEQS